MKSKFFYLVSGMSGAGKSTVLNVLEDSEFYCVDNLPVDLFDKLIELFLHSPKNLQKVALALDIRAGAHFSRVVESMKSLSEKGVNFWTIFLDCTDTVLVRRFKETRRRHPLYKGNLQDALRRERRILSPLRDNADILIDTTSLKTRELSHQILELLNKDKSEIPFHVTLTSFGFKHGLPQEADLVFDVRFMNNPFYDEGLRSKTGHHQDVSDYVFSQPEANVYISEVCRFLNFILPLYIKEGRKQLCVAFGCTGGHHRSVACVEKLFEQFESSKEIFFQRVHRDCRK